MCVRAPLSFVAVREVIRIDSSVAFVPLPRGTSSLLSHPAASDSIICPLDTCARLEESCQRALSARNFSSRPQSDGCLDMAHGGCVQLARVSGSLARLMSNTGNSH